MAYGPLQIQNFATDKATCAIFETPASAPAWAAKLTFGATVPGTQASINKKCKIGVLSTPEKLLDHPSHY